MPELSKRLKERASLYVLGALSSRETESFEKDLEKSNALRRYVEELTATLEAVSHVPSKEPSESLLQRQRNLLRGRIDMMRAEPFYDSFVRKAKDILYSLYELFFFSGKPALAAVTYVLIGLFVGRFLLVSPTVTETPITPTLTVEERIQRLMDTDQLAETQIRPMGNGTKKVAFRLKAEDEFTYSGGVKDETVRDLLAYLLLNETNPGKRLRSVKLLSDLTPDEEMKMVLVSAVLHDENPGVRLRAIKNLNNYAIDKTIRDACTKILLEDQNTAVRMEALRILAKDPHERLVPVLQVVSHLDANEFIREEAAAMLDALTSFTTPQRIEETE